MKCIKGIKELKMTGKMEALLVVLLLAIGIFIRAYHFGIIPVGLHQDEAMAAVDAKALAEYGTDRFGMRYPVHFTAWTSGQMSVLLSYFMVPFIKILGFSITTIRLPMLVISCVGLMCLYFVGKKVDGVWLGLIALMLGIVCPWHYMQSRWSIDCNMFPHVFLIGVWLMLVGLKRKWIIYFSMVFFGLCSYCYGLANYSVPLFLLVAAIILIRKKAVSIKQGGFCVLIYFLVAGPEFLTMIINAFGWQTIQTKLFTIPYFPQSARSGNILFLNFSWEQLWNNMKDTVLVLFFNGDTITSHSIPSYGPLYHFTTIFFIIGLVVLFRKIKQADDITEKIPYVIILAWFLMGIWIGIVTERPLINRLNVIFYSMLMISAIGIRWCVSQAKVLAIPIFALYAVSALLFAYTYFRGWADKSRDFYYESYVNALYYADTIPCDYYYISTDPQGDRVREVGRILTMFCHEIDAEYFQGKTNIQGGVERLPYAERYTYYLGDELTAEIVENNKGKSVVYLIGPGEVDLFSEEEYTLTSFYDSYFVVTAR